ncbi:Oidioi.mRNA.OKI2018_I69.chr1.g3579.t1.cds [Oikopleura dioica]|uniref:Oidioi.mRNA.OKI2018_I69.chr1.g3579.t1.cds n=1 Tax=Oikopleura dioica TaxID=34765 RepID=A0ABN7T132_OIKDI|nr:Oidioi.mRNA.OKI2018_I69.chr1.g3579.t1.cds [Oikopleura dioica]
MLSSNRAVQRCLKRHNASKTLSWFSRVAFPVNFVPQQEIYVIERFGKFARSSPGGPMFKKAITKDNVTIDIDGVLYIKIKDAEKASYGVDDSEFAIKQLAQTTMRSEIGKLTLDGLFSEREELNSRICSSINEASLDWGMSALRYEIKDIEIPSEIRQAMQRQVEAERTKRAEILRSEGVRESAINEAEGQRQARILQSEAQRMELINEAEGERQAAILRAEAKAKAIEVVAERLAAENGRQAADYDLAAQYIDAFSELAQEGNTLILPADVGNIPSTVATAMTTLEKIQSAKADK